MLRPLFEIWGGGGLLSQQQGLKLGAVLVKAFLSLQRAFVESTTAQGRPDAVLLAYCRFLCETHDSYRDEDGKQDHLMKFSVEGRNGTIEVGVSACDILDIPEFAASCKDRFMDSDRAS